MRYHIETHDKSVISSNFTPEALLDLQMYPMGASVVDGCRMHNVKCRKESLVCESGTIYFCWDLNTQAKRVFKEKLRLLAENLTFLTSARQSIVTEEERKIADLRHNLITLNGRAIQAIYTLIPQEALGRGTAQQLTAIKRVIKQDRDAVASLILKLNKIEALVKSEFHVQDVLNGTSKKPGLSCNKILSVVYIAYNVFSTDFDEKGIKVSIDKSDAQVLLDYPTFATALNQLFSNAVKYSLPKSEMYISFKDAGERLELCFDMTSLKVDQGELEDIFKRGHCGILSGKLGLSGNGIGLYVAKKCMDLNQAEISFLPNVSPADEVALHGICYQRNRIIIALRRCD